jgi:hypothetical protein
MAVTVAQPFVKAAIAILCEAWPARLRFSDVLDRAQQKLPQADPAGPEMLSELLMKMYGAGLLEIDTSPWPYPPNVPERPCVTQLARFQAKEGARVTSLRHQAVDLDDPQARLLIPLLDGSRDRGALLRDSGLEPSVLDDYLKKLSNLSLLVA